MNFVADKQTLDDLNLTGKYKPDSIYSLFNRVQTAGGERWLEALFRQPLVDVEEINKRSGLFQYFQRKELVFPFNKELLSLMEGYLSAGGGGRLLGVMAGVARKKVLDMIVRDEAYGDLLAGITATVEVLKIFYELMIRLEEDGPFCEQVQQVKEIFGDRRLEWLWEVDVQGLSWWKLARYEHVLRGVMEREMSVVMDIIYQLDVNIAVAGVAAAKGFSYAVALPRDQGMIRVHGLRHPRLDKGVGNAVSLCWESNMLFLTGANMAGKSTLMKSFGIAVYLAHMGFPVAAEEMYFSVRDGIYSSINVPDNLSLGHSHFYAEVLRVKKVAEEVSLGKDLVVIFDELFKGTNVKDAYDATLAVTRELAEYRNCWFVISTHIIEVGEELRSLCGNIQFVYLPTVMEGMAPRYTYVLKEGITADRHGMMIIEQEGVLEMIVGGGGGQL